MTRRKTRWEVWSGPSLAAARLARQWRRLVREERTTWLLGVAKVYAPEVVGDVVARDTRMALRRRINGDGR